jgi:hypothetical protein
MNTKLCLVLLAISVTLGCSRNLRLYPVQGQLAAQTPSPVLIAKIAGGLTSGVFSVVLSDGEVCKGSRAQVPTVRVAEGGTSATA